MCVDRNTKLTRSLAVTPANVSDCGLVGELVYGAGTHAWGDAAYDCQAGHIRQQAPRANDFTQRRGGSNRYLADHDRWITRAR